MIPSLPFLAVGIARAGSAPPQLVRCSSSSRRSRWCGRSWLRHLVPDGGYLVRSQLSDVQQHGFMPTLFTLGLGVTIGWIVHVVLVLAAMRHLDRELPAAPSLTVRAAVALRATSTPPARRG